MVHLQLLDQRIAHEGERTSRIGDGGGHVRARHHDRAHERFLCQAVEHHAAHRIRQRRPWRGWRQGRVRHAHAR